MFTKLKKQVQTQLDSFTASKQTLYSVTVDREKIWELYINGFDESVKQEHTCNCCKSFLRQYGSIVIIKDNKIVSIWDIEVEEEYKKSVEALRKYIHSLPITNVFVNAFSGLGTDKNTQLVEGKPIIWNHFYYNLDRHYIRHKDTIDTYLGQCRDNKSVLKRSLDELTMEAIDTVLELIGQNSLYRGKEFESMVTSFKSIKVLYDKLPDDQKDNFAWVQSTAFSQAVSRIRNTSIGTLLTDLSEGRELDSAVTAFERVVAPTNYKRPTALVTPRMVEEAKKKIEELGFAESLERRLAASEDISVDNLIYADRSSEVTDVFDQIAKETKVNPKSLTKVEEITIDDFLSNVVPKSKSIEVLLENSHLNNMVTLLTGENKEAPSMFKWPNAFSWSYTGGITDSMRERVAAAGGRVDGVFRFTHSWNEIEPNQSLMDLHVFMPGCELPKQWHHGPHVKGRRVGWNHRTDTLSGGTQDVDYTSAAPKGYVPIENITFPDIKRMPEGKYTCMINNWSFRGTGGRGKAEIEFGGNIYQYEYPATKLNEWVTIAEVTLKDGQFTIEHKIPESTSSKEKWGVSTNQFVKVKSIMYSPNHWNGKVGNKHYIFALEGCVPDETPRPFFNEFLKEDLDKNRKVLEILGSKIKIGKVENPVSGVGFSETQRNHMFVKVQGTFKRTLKVNF